MFTVVMAQRQQLSAPASSADACSLLSVTKSQQFEQMLKLSFSGKVQHRIQVKTLT